MKVIIDDKTYKIYWQHSLPSSTNPKLSKVEPFKTGGTTCTIEEWGTYELFCNGHAYLSLKDKNFNKSKGRIVSLTKAIKHLPKDVRKLFWDEYKKQINFK